MASRRSGRTSGAAALRDAPSSPSDSHISVNVKTASKTRQVGRPSGRRSERFEGGEIVTGTRNRGGRKNYVIDSSPDEDEEEEDDDDDEAEVEDDDLEDDDLGDEDAEGEEMEMDAEGEEVDGEGEEDAEGEDAEGDVDMDASEAPTAPTIRVSQPSAPRSAARVAASKIAKEGAGDDDDDDDEVEDDDGGDDGDDGGDDDEDEEEEEDDDDELSDPGESDAGGQTLGLVDETMAEEYADEDAEGEEIEVAGEGDAGRAEPNSDEDGSQDGSPDLTKMTKRQRARFEDEPHEYMKLSDEVQVKKHFTAEELSMRRQEMARRRRNLSEKRTEEVKMETINKLLKKQAPKINRKVAAGGGRAASPDEDEQRPSPIFVRWVSNKDGSRLSVPEELVSGPLGDLFSPRRGLRQGKTVEEVM